MKKLLFISILLLTSSNAISQSMGYLPTIKNFWWGMNYDNVIEILNEEERNYGDDNGIEKTGRAIICYDWHIFCDNIGLSKGYNTVFRFNSKNELFSIFVILTESYLLELNQKGIITDAFSYIKWTNGEWLILEQRYGTETTKSTPDFSDYCFKQYIYWIYENGSISFIRSWESSHRKFKDYTHLITMVCNTYLDK